MPKERSVSSLSSHHAKASPYLRSSVNAEQNKSRNSLGSIEDVKRWEDVRCPICMEHPHNAVMIWCSSYEKGCRPYICNTSYRHSNCLDQFCKSTASSPSTLLLQEIPVSSTMSHRKDEMSLPGHIRPCGSPLEPNIVCPLCRGQIYGWSVNKQARQFMNSKPRSCSSDSCDFEGIYSELRKHARSKHPSVRPAVVDQAHQLAWTRFEQERDAADILSTFQMQFGEGWNENDMLSAFQVYGSATFFLRRSHLEVDMIPLGLYSHFDPESYVTLQSNNLSAGSEQLTIRLGRVPERSLNSSTAGLMIQDERSQEGTFSVNYDDFRFSDSTNSIDTTLGMLNDPRSGGTRVSNVREHSPPSATSTMLSTDRQMHAHNQNPTWSDDSRDRVQLHNRPTTFPG